MIDDQEKVAQLLEKMKAHFPIPAEVPRGLARHLREQGASVPHHRNVLIQSALNGGDEGGILCAISPPGSETVVLTSLTHLKIPYRHPLEKEIRAYQKARTQKLR